MFRDANWLILLENTRVVFRKSRQFENDFDVVLDLLCDSGMHDFHDDRRTVEPSTMNLPNRPGSESPIVELFEHVLRASPEFFMERFADFGGRIGRSTRLKLRKFLGQ